MEVIDLRKLRYIGVAVSIVAILAILLYSFITRKGDKEELDLNNFEIETLTNDQIVNISGDCRAVLTKWGASGDNSGIVHSEYIKADSDKTKFSAKEITGIKTISATLAKDCTFTISIDSKVGNGKAQIVVIQDDKIIERLDATTSTTLEYIVVGEHQFYIKILCEEAQIEINTQRYRV